MRAPQNRAISSENAVAQETTGDVRFSAVVEGDIDIVVIDGEGRVDSLRADGGELDGIPTCSLLDEGMPPDMKVFVGIEGAAPGSYVIWLRSRVEGGRVGISWIRPEDESWDACEGSSS
jgi:hypothetical protein